MNYSVIIDTKKCLLEFMQLCTNKQNKCTSKSNSGGGGGGVGGIYPSLYRSSVEGGRRGKLHLMDTIHNNHSPRRVGHYGIFH